MTAVDLDALDQARARIRHGLAARRSQLLEPLLEQVVPNLDPARLGDISEAGQRGIDISIDAVLSGRTVDVESIADTRAFFRHAMLRGSTEGELMRSCRLIQRVVLAALIELASDSIEGQAAVTELVPLLIDAIETISGLAAETFEEMHNALRETTSDERLRLLETLVSGQVLGLAGRQLDLLRLHGLTHSGSLVVISAMLADERTDSAAVTPAAAALARSAHSGVPPLVGVRDREIVIIRSTRDSELSELRSRLEEAWTQLAAHGSLLAIGISTLRTGPSEVAPAYAEAWLAREKSISAQRPVALSELSALDYLVLSSDRTAWTLVEPRIREFFEDRGKRSDALVETLDAYVECDMNAVLVAEKLFMHPNSARYRLTQLEQRTGCDLRSVADVIDLVVAARLAGRSRPIT